MRSATLNTGEVIGSQVFINAGGPWAADIAAMVGADLPVVPMPRAQHFWRCHDDVEPLPLVKDETGMFFRPDGGGFAGGRPSFGITPGFADDFNSGFFETYFEDVVWPLIAKRLPKFKAIKLERTWGGHYAQNMFDGNMILGRFVRGIDNLITACGFSGHGVMHAIRLHTDGWIQRHRYFYLPGE